MSNVVKCSSCGAEVVPMAVGNKNFCPECEAELVAAAPVETVHEQPAGKPAPEASSSGTGHVISDGMGMIEENRTKIGAVETFSDNSVTNHNHTTNTTNISNITQIADDTKKSVVCEISGRKVLVTSSVVCPVCGKTVAEQYYDETKLRCVACEKKAVEAYEKFYKEMVAGARVIDAELRSVLDAKAASFKLTEAQAKEAELKLRKTVSDKQERLSDIQQRDFDRTISQLKEGKIAAAPCLSKISAYAKLTDDAAVQCWYRLLSAVSSPEHYLDDMKNAGVDDYWQLYWGFVAAVKTRNTTEAVLCVDTAKSKYPENINDITLALACLEVLQYMETKDSSYLTDAKNDLSCVVETESRCLQEFRERLKTAVAASGLQQMNVEKLLLTRPSAPAAPTAPAAHNTAAPSATKPVSAASAAPVKPAVQAEKPSQETKGYTLNTAGGPLNPTVASFTQATAPQPKKKSGGLVAFVVLALVGAGAYFFFTGSDKEQPAAETTAVQTVNDEAKVAAPAAAEQKSAQSVETVEKATAAKESMAAEPAASQPAASAPVASEPVAVPEAKKTMAAKAAGAVSSTVAATAASQSDALKQAKEAYEKGDYRLAHDLFKSAAASGDAEACYQLGMMLSTGKGSVVKNTLQAKVWLKKAVGLGHAEASKVLETL